MAIKRYHPFGDLLRWVDNVNSMLDESDRDPMSVSAWSPKVDIHEDENQYLFQVELPGMDKKDINVEIENDQLVLSGEKKHRKEFKEENCHRFESGIGKFYRSFQIPKSIQQDKVKASMKNGVLELMLPKAEEKKKKSIPVDVK